MVVNNFLLTIAKILDNILFLYTWVVIISALLSWVNPDPYNPIVRAIRGITEPVFRRVRRLMPFLSTGGMDFTPLAVVLILYFIQGVVVTSIYNWAGIPTLHR